MATSRLVKDILKDIEQTLTELRSKELWRDERSPSQRMTSGNKMEISFSGKNDTSSIVYDNHITSSEMINTLVINHQYNILFYDKSFIQAEFIVDGNNVIKERLAFMKKHNKIWDAEEIQDYESNDIDWFQEDFGVPIMLRIDYAPDEHVECDHAVTHLTISNHESCRIPMKGIVSFSEFVRFILFHFYKTKLDLPVWCFDNSDTITELEKKMIHMNWK